MTDVAQHRPPDRDAAGAAEPLRGPAHVHRADALREERDDRARQV